MALPAALTDTWVATIIRSLVSCGSSLRVTELTESFATRVDLVTCGDAHGKKNDAILQIAICVTQKRVVMATYFDRPTLVRDWKDTS